MASPWWWSPTTPESPAAARRRSDMRDGQIVRDGPVGTIRDQEAGAGKAAVFPAARRRSAAAGHRRPRTRRVPAALSVLGISIGIAAMAAALGVTRSSQSDLPARL